MDLKSKRLLPQVIILFGESWQNLTDYMDIGLQLKYENPPNGFMNSSSKYPIIMLLHGLGDNILLFPALYDYYLQNGKIKLDLVVMKVYGASNFWENINFVDKVYEISPESHPAYWNPLRFYTKDYFTCIHLVENVAGRNNIIFLKITVFPLFFENFLSLFLNRHKLNKAYNELKVEPVNNNKFLNLETFFKNKSDRRVEMFLKKHRLKKKSYIVIHGKTFAESKSLPKSQIQKLIKAYPKLNFVVIMNSAMKKDEEVNENGNINEKNVVYTTEVAFTISELYYLLKYSFCNILIDSAMMHLSQFVKTPTLALFRVRKVKPDLVAPYSKNIKIAKVYNAESESESMSKFINILNLNKSENT